MATNTQQVGAPEPLKLGVLPGGSATVAALRERLAAWIGTPDAVEKELQIPPRAFYIPWDASTTYGVNRILNRYCGFHFPGEWPLAGFWSHGWVPSFGLFHPCQVSHQAKPGEYQLNLVPREDSAQVLRRAGFPNVRAVGLPICYLPNLRSGRIPKSVLVAPAHSPPDYRTSGTADRGMVNLLKELRERFDLVVGCLHPQCLKNGFWVREFEAAQVPFVTGAAMRDANSLYRMQRLFSLFEHVTTNGFGSILAYASLFGAKVWIKGQFQPLRREQFAKDPFYVKNPDVLEAALKLYSEAILRQACPFFWDGPDLAVPRVEWAKQELGWGCRPSPQEAVEVFGLQPSVRLRNGIRASGRKAAYAVARRWFRLRH